MSMGVLFFLILFPTLSFATSTPVSISHADDCSFNFADFHSTLDHNSPKYKFISVEKKDDIKKYLSQTAQLKSDVKPVESTNFRAAMRSAS